MNTCMICGEKISIRSRLWTLVTFGGLTCEKCGTEYHEVRLLGSLISSVLVYVMALYIMLEIPGSIWLKIILLLVFIPVSEVWLTYRKVYILNEDNKSK